MAQGAEDVHVDYGDQDEPSFLMPEGDGPAGDGMGLVCDTLADFLETASVDSVFAEPVVHGDSLVIPAAEVVASMGFGVGPGQGARARLASSRPGGAAIGGGGGGWVRARPVAVIIMSPEGVRVRAVVDPTKIVLAALVAGAFMVAAIARIFLPAGRR